MSLAGEQVLLRVFLSSADRAPWTPTHERLVRAARTAKMAGATVIRGILGVGYHGLMKNSAWSLAEHVPLIVEIVDSHEKIVSFIQGPMSQIMIGGVATLERAVVMMYRHRAQPHAGDLQISAELKPLSTLPRIEETERMQINENGILLRVFAGESDRFEHRPLHEAIVQKVRELGMAGATVLRGSEGFGAHSIVHTSNLLAMSTDLPIVIEIVDSQEKIQSLLPHLQAMVQEGMITMEYVMVLLYRHREGAGATP